MYLKKIIAAALTAAMLLTGAAPKVYAGEILLSLPENMDTCFKTYMDYRKITDKSSDQYKLQQKAYTDSDGIRRVDGDVCIAVGTYYADKIGQRLEITLDSGNIFTAVVGDFKADCFTDEKHMYYPINDTLADVTEFIVDVKKLDEYVRLMGSIGEYEKYSGNIVSIKMLRG